MASVQRLVDTWMAAPRDEEIDTIVLDIVEGRSSLLEVVKALGEYLTSEKEEALQKGVDLLASVVGRVPKEKMNLQTVRVLTTFFVGKLSDYVTLKQALGGIVHLVTLPTFSPAEATTVIEGIFRHVRMRTLVQDFRFKVFSIIDSLMAYHRGVLKSMGGDFLGNYIALAEGEKDPRNLMIAFAIARVILIEFDITKHTESLFNILFCYFPITFRPPPNDKYGITTDDLRGNLRRCLCATPSFGLLAIPVFLEKLTAGSRATKKDTLQTLSTCLPVYGPGVGRSFARKLWNSLKLEIFQPVDTQAEGDAIKAIQVLVKTIYTAEEAAVESNEDIHGLARDACEECIQVLKEPEKTQARASIKILCAFLSTTPSISRYTFAQAVLHLVRLFLNPDEASTRSATLGLLAELITAAVDSRVPSEDKSETVPALLPYKDEVLGICTVGLQLSALRAPALSGLIAMASTDGLLTDEEHAFVVHKVGDVLQGDGDEYDDASDAALSLLSKIAQRSPRHLSEQTLPMLFSSLPDQAPARDAASERDKCWRTLNALRKLCVNQELFENLVSRLTTKLDLLLFSKGLPVEDIEITQAYAHMILKTLAQTLGDKVKAKHADVAKHVDRLIPCIYNLFVASALSSEVETTIAVEPRLISVAGEVITLVIQSLPSARQKTYQEGLSKAILIGDFTDLAQGPQKLSNTARLLVLQDTSTHIHREILVLLGAAIVPLHKEVELSIGNQTEFLNKLLSWTLGKADTDSQRLAALHIVSSIINRHAEDLASFLQDKLDLFWLREVVDRNSSIERRKWAIRSWSWITKALLVRKHPQAILFAERLYDAFEDDDIGWEAAKALGDIARPDQVLSKANHAVIKILFVQKYVNKVLPRLIKSAKDGDSPGERTASLVALSSVIKAIPRAAYVHEMPTLIPLLLRGLGLPDAEIRSNVIDTLLAAAEGETPENNMISEHSATLVESMLMNSRVDEMPSVKVRISALRYLAVLPSIVRYDVLHPSRAIVIRELAKVLDDPKRSVRKEAVDARTNWFKYKG